MKTPRACAVEPRGNSCTSIVFRLRCVFSIGGDGALHVLDDADAKGYVKPPAPSDARRKARRMTSSNSGRGVSAGADNNRSDDIGVVRSDDDVAGDQGGRRGQRRTPLQHERTKLKDGILRSDRGVHPGEVEVPRAGEAAEGLVPTDGGVSGVKQRGDGGRSVLLRQVVLSSGDDHENAADNDNSITGKDEREREHAAARPYNPTGGRRDRRNPGAPPPSQQPRGVSVEAIGPESDTLDDEGVSAEHPMDSSGSASSSIKSR